MIPADHERRLKSRYLFQVAFALRAAPKLVVEERTRELNTAIDDEIEQVIAEGADPQSAERSVVDRWIPAVRMAAKLQGPSKRSVLASAFWHVAGMLLVLCGAHYASSVPKVMSWTQEWIYLASGLAVAVGALAFSLRLVPIAFAPRRVFAATAVVEGLTAGAAFSAMVPIMSLATGTFSTDFHTWNFDIAAHHIPMRMLWLLVPSGIAARVFSTVSEHRRDLRRYLNLRRFAKAYWAARHESLYGADERRFQYFTEDI